MLYKYTKREIVRNSPKNKKSKRPRNKLSISLAALCLISGLSLLVYATFPYIDSLSTKQSNKHLLNPSYIGASSASFQKTNEQVSGNYAQNVNKNISKTNEILNIDRKTFPEYSNVKGEMKLSIPSLKVTKLPVILNVDSFNESVYMPFLEKSFAHFKGTSLPDKPGNTFIYGHSANELLAKSYSNTPKYAFSFLGDMEIGDEVVVNFNGKDYKYAMYKSRLVSPDDISPIYSTSSDQSLTLMTCWPPGIGSDRLIILAKLVEES